MIDNNDSYVSEEEEDLCPLCVEEMDLSDKNFKPCPCGYQICQFCYNNIISNPDLNHNCPACRRVYSKDTVEYKVLSPDELNLLKLKQLEKQRKRKQREKELRDAEQASKKQLAGMRVIQKNLVYVVGLNLPGSTEDLQTLFRSDSYFGQYGKISKVVVNRKSPNPANPHSAPGLSVYVTFVRKEDALKCIQAVDGSISDGRLLKAAHGTTKYCSSYLRGQQCPNPNCMFLHEPGEEAESYNRENMSNRRIHNEVRSAIHGLAPALNGTPVMPNATLDTLSSLYQLNNNSSNGIQGNNNGGVNQYYYKSSNNNNGNNSEDEDDENGPLLPPTANWGKGSSSNLYNMNYQHLSSNLDNANLATAFPTLGESVQLQQHVAKEIKKKEKRKEVDNNGNTEYIDSTKDARAVLKGISDALSLFDPSFVRFDSDKIDQTEFNGYPKLFNFTPGSPSLPDNNTKDISTKIVDNLLINKTNNHILGVQNIQFILQLHQQQQRSQQQQQQQQPKQPSQDASTAAAAVLAQQQYFAQQQRLQRLQQQQQLQQQSHTPLTPAANLTLLHQQQQQQQQQGNTSQLQSLYQQQQQQQQMMAAAAAHQMKLNPSNGTSAPAPPGLFSGVSLNNVTGHVNSENSSNNAASSELLNHLLAGKK